MLDVQKNISAKDAMVFMNTCCIRLVEKHHTGLSLQMYQLHCTACWGRGYQKSWLPVQQCIL